MKKILFIAFILLLFHAGGYAQHYKKDGTPDMRFKENRSSSYSGGSSYHRSSNYTPRATSFYGSRSSKGKIKRSAEAKHKFMRSTGYPKGRPGYVIDHIVPLKRGGCDCPSNMQWQTKEAAKEKDKWE